MSKSFVYISCWANLGGEPGIGIYEYDTQTGKLTPVDVVQKDLSCGTTYFSKKSGLLYFCIEEEDHPAFRKGGGGRLVAFRPDPETGALEQVDEIATLSPNPSYICSDPEGRYLAVSNHASNNAVTKIVKGEDNKYRCSVVYDDCVVDLIALKDDGSFDGIVDVAFHSGNSKKKLHPHPHCAVMAPSGRFFVVCDKGNDKIYSYSIDAENGRLVSCGEPFQDTDGSAPRYCRFHPTLPYLYVNHEGRPNVTVLRYDEEGNLSLVDRVNSVADPDAYPRGKGQSGILMHPTGNWLYTILNATASIAVFEIDRATGLPQLVQDMPSGQEKLRAFELSPDGKFLIAATIQSGAIETYTVGEDGRLSKTGYSETLHGAAYVTFVD